MKEKRNYQEEAEKLAKAIDIAVEAFRLHCPEKLKSHQDHFIKCYLEWKDDALHPEHQYKNLTSLKYDEVAVFTYFLESKGEMIEYFWRRIKEAGLDYPREDKLAKIFQRGKIKGRIEWEYANDVIVAAEQEGRITEAEAMRLSEMIGEFENRPRKRKKKE